MYIQIFKMINIIGKLHSWNRNNLISQNIELIIKHFLKNNKISSIYSNYLIEKGSIADVCIPFLNDPTKSFCSMVIVLKSPDTRSKGLIVLKYSYFFPLFLKLFDVNEIQKNYHICLEPSWSGYFNEEILSMINLKENIYVQSIEPKDSSFLKNCTKNLKPVNTAANYWVDYRIFNPEINKTKDIDIIMVSSWAKFKRHKNVFYHVKKLKQRGYKTKIALVGYPFDLSKDNIWSIAKFFSIEKQVEIFENLSVNEVAEQFNRSKVNLLWSKKEGVNRSIIEGMFCNIPCILPEGFNYGFRYHYINNDTGRYVKENELDKGIIDVIEKIDDFKPRKYVEANITWKNATDIIKREINDHLNEEGLEFSGNLSGKVNLLDGMQYCNPADKEKYRLDYEYLQKNILV